MISKDFKVIISNSFGYNDTVTLKKIKNTLLVKEENNMPGMLLELHARHAIA